jgi:hypothetical protein
MDKDKERDMDKDKDRDMDKNKERDVDKNKERDVEMPKVASREAWLRARKELLMKEKEWNRQRDALSAERRKLPMVRNRKGLRVRGAARDARPERVPARWCSPVP